MRFEAKHNFFKKIVRQTSSFRNILLSMAKKHQSMIAYHLHSSNVKKPAVTVSKMTTLPVEVVNESVQDFLAQKFPKETVVNLTKTAEFQGTSYAVGMMLVYGSTSGLPDLSYCAFTPPPVRASKLALAKIRSGRPANDAVERFVDTLTIERLVLYLKEPKRNQACLSCAD